MILKRCDISPQRRNIFIDMVLARVIPVAIVVASCFFFAMGALVIQ